MKKGFTLAEILITLTIVGVVAALTLPALMTNVSQAKVGPSLAKFVNTFENGARQYMFENEVATLSPDDVLEHFGEYIIWSKPTEKDLENYNPMGADGNEINNSPALKSPTVETTRILKDGGMVILPLRSATGD